MAGDRTQRRLAELANPAAGRLAADADAVPRLSMS